MLRTILGMLAIFFIFRMLWRFFGLLSSPPPKKETKSKPSRTQKPILKGGEYVTYEEVKE